MLGAVVRGNKWAAALRCYNCGEKFRVEDVTFDKVNGLALVVPCPSCGARPFIAPPGGPEASRLHKLIELVDWLEPSPPMRVPLQLKPEWYRRLEERVVPGSEAEICLKNSRRLPGDGGYFLLCDDGGLATLAALANASRCPEAIQAVRAAYLAAINGRVDYSQLALSSQSSGTK